MIPLPSFFKIRLAAICLAFLLLFLLIGFGKWCFAFTCADSPCYITTMVGQDKIAGGGFYYFYTYDLGDTCSAPTFSLVGSIAPPEGTTFYSYKIQKSFWNGTSWSIIGSTSIYLNMLTKPSFPIGDPVDLFPNGCGDIPPDCEALLAAANAACPYGLLSFDCELGEYQCKGRPCSDWQADCPPSDAVNVTCIFSSDGEDETGECINPQCLCLPLSCPEKRARCEDSCGGASNVAVNSCLEENGVIISSECKCFTPDGDGTYTPPDPDDPSIPGDPDQPDPDDVDNTPDPDNESGTPETSDPDDTSDELTRKLVDNSEKIAQTLDRELNELNTEADRIRTTLDSIDDKLTTSLDGEYSPQEFDPNFDQSALTQDFSQFSDRFSAFFTDIQNTSLFGLTDDIIFDIPSGGTSTISVDLGSYGNVDIDFAAWSTQLRILRYVFLTCFSFAAIRIAVSKK